MERLERFYAKKSRLSVSALNLSKILHKNAIEILAKWQKNVYYFMLIIYIYDWNLFLKQLFWQVPRKTGHGCCVRKRHSAWTLSWFETWLRRFPRFANLSSLSDAVGGVRTSPYLRGKRIYEKIKTIFSLKILNRLKENFWFTTI